MTENSQNSETFPMMLFEKEILANLHEHDSLLIIAKGLSYNTVLSNFLLMYNAPCFLVLVINASEHEENYFIKKLNLKIMPMNVNQREKAYLDGGVHFISRRITVVDLLKGRIPIEHVTGIVVLRAHKVLESCQEAFALRLFRQKNKAGFIKGLSNSPISFTFGYGHVDRIMKSLFVTELFLWPRFHKSVISSLKQRQANVVELHIPLSTKMTLIQNCLIDIMNYTLKMLKISNKALDMQEITIENCITKKFHKILQSQLDSVWHQLSTKTKEYIQDLQIFRSMIFNLINDDSVSFYSLVTKYKSPEYAKLNSGWILLDTAEQLFKHSKDRVFNTKKEFDPEPSPKWQCLSDLLSSEIPNDVKSKENLRLSSAKILILCHDKRTCAQLNHYLTLGAPKFTLYMALRRGIYVNTLAKQSLDVQDKQIREVLEEDDDDFKSNYILTQHIQEDIEQSIFEPFTQLQNLDLSKIEGEAPLICIQTFKEEGNSLFLESTLFDLKPQYIIMYHSDVSAIRQIECYVCKMSDDESLNTVYLLIHDKTVEEQAYLTSLKREKQAFELLIQTKGNMVIPSYQDGKSDELFNVSINNEEENVDTRSAGGQSNIVLNEKPMVVVDTREFRSDLPALLHKRGINIQPVTITVGDYILTPDICVERKSISDLIGSLNSGRLFTQATQMCRNYSRPILLIEFEQNKPFNLQANVVSSGDMSIQQKLQLLTIHFPRLKLVWSPSPYATAELFYELKQGKNNPIIEVTRALGDETPDDMNERYNTIIYDFIQKLPGVTTKNINKIMNKGKSLHHLIKQSQVELAHLLENKDEAETLWKILHMESKPLDTKSKDEKPYLKRKYTSRMFTKK